MQAATVIFTASWPFKGTTKTLTVPNRLSRPQRTVGFRIASVPEASEISTVDYSSATSVFPAEACDTIGGEACMVEMFPEAKPVTPVTTSEASMSLEEVEREYIDYNEPKTVFPGEACDDLGGEFCEPEYQKDVFVEKAASR